MSSNTVDLVVETLVDSVINSMKLQSNGKIPPAVLDTMRTAAILAASSAVPGPVRLAINAVPVSAVKTAAGGIKAVKNDVAGGAKAIGETVTGLIKNKIAG
jgi:hypothetical protein